MLYVCVCVLSVPILYVSGDDTMQSVGNMYPKCVCIHRCLRLYASLVSVRSVTNAERLCLATHALPLPASTGPVYKRVRGALVSTFYDGSGGWIWFERKVNLIFATVFLIRRVFTLEGQIRRKKAWCLWECPCTYLLACGCTNIHTVPCV